MNGRAKRTEMSEASKENKHVLLFPLSPDPLPAGSPLSAGLILSPAPRSGDELAKGSVCGNNRRAYTASRAFEQTGNGPLPHYRSTGPYSHIATTRRRTSRMESEEVGMTKRAVFVSSFSPHVPHHETLPPTRHDETRRA